MRDQDRGLARRFEIGNVLHRHDGALIEEPAETDGVDSVGARGINAEAAHVFEPIEQRDHVGGRRRFRVIPQPRESGATQRGIEGQEPFERLPRCVAQTLRHDLEGPFASAHTCGEPDSLQHRHGRDEHIVGPQMREHRPYDRLTAIGSPSGVGAHRQAGAPVGQPEAAQEQQLLQFGGMLPSRLVPQGVPGEGRGRVPKLVSDEGDHRFGRMLADAQALARMPQQAQLDGEAQSVAAAPFGPNERQVFGAQHVVLRHSADPLGCRTDGCAVPK